MILEGYIVFSDVSEMRNAEQSGLPRGIAEKTENRNEVRNPSSPMNNCDSGKSFLVKTIFPAVCEFRNRKSEKVFALLIALHHKRT